VFGPVRATLSLWAKDPVSFLMQEVDKVHDWNYNKCDIPSEFDRIVTQIIVYVYNYSCFIDSFTIGNFV
jgi:hypothetical protein